MDEPRAMLRKKRDSLKGVPTEVRHSLEFLDNLLDQFDDQKSGIPGSTLRNIKKIPPDARKSLEILDNVLGEFDIDESRRSESADNIRVTQNVTEEVNKSIEVLDRVLDEFQNEGGRPVVERRRKIERNESLQRSRHDDIRRSLEVLDNVLAEFDDCLESWDTITRDAGPPENGSLRLHKELNIPSNYSSLSYDSQTTDGSTSHDSGFSLQEQIKIASPPPIPKRSASTKLSDRSSGLFTFSDGHFFDSLPPDLLLRDNQTNLSENDVISTLSAKDDDEVFKNNDCISKAYCCIKCGCEIEVTGQGMERKVEKDSSSSPFLEKRKMFEDRISESKISVSPLLGRSFTGSSFKVKPDKTKECASEPSSLLFYKTTEIDRCDSRQSSFVLKYSPKATKVTPPKIEGYLTLTNNSQHAPNCNCKERIRQLQVKFAETRRLLKANKIRGIDAKPPSFLPPPPPTGTIAKNVHNEMESSRKHQLSNGFSGSSVISNSNSYSASNGSLNSESFNSEISEISHPSPIPDSEKNLPSSDIISDERKLCNRCSTTESAPISGTIEDLPKLTPTDALKRPHLGFDLCMEEDFSPGVKEILQTSTPRNGLSKNNKMNSLSTFSLSETSLGYVSSQSDLEISSSPIRMEKVPVTSMKFSTLPEGMDLHSLPSYYGHDGNTENHQHLYRDRNFNHTTDPLLRSSSASPLPETEKPKKKHFRGFSRKDKKDKKKNGDNISVKSYLSLNDEVILNTIDGDTSKYNAADSQETGVEKKRWSGLRSLLNRR